MLKTQNIIAQTMVLHGCQLILPWWDLQRATTLGLLSVHMSKKNTRAVFSYTVPAPSSQRTDWLAGARSQVGFLKKSNKHPPQTGLQLHRLRNSGKSAYNIKKSMQISCIQKDTHLHFLLPRASSQNLPYPTNSCQPLKSLSLSPPPLPPSTP